MRELKGRGALRTAAFWVLLALVVVGGRLILRQLFRAVAWTKMPEVFTAMGRDGKTDIWGVIYRPMNFSAAKNMSSVSS